jgi:hypothetical protein
MGGAVFSSILSTEAVRDKAEIEYEINKIKEASHAGGSCIFLAFNTELNSRMTPVVCPM